MTINFFDTSFYDKESGQYSGKRYNTRARSYVQFFFQERLRHVIKLVGKYLKNESVLIEDGCADGVVADAVYRTYKESFKQVIGTDISPGMIKAAKEMNTHSAISYYVKNEFPDIKADIFLAVGFVSPGIFEDEFSFVEKHLKNDGILIVSLVNRDSLYTRLKLKDREITQDYWEFKKYDDYLSKKYEIIEKKSYGFFVPKLWAVPALARVLQPVFELLSPLFPSLFHETLYVLKKR